MRKSSLNTWHALKWSLLALALLSSGCTSYRHHRAGQAAIADGRLAEGVAKLRLASELSPSDEQYKRDYVLQRDMVIAKLLRQAAQELDVPNYDAAKAAYSEILAIQADNNRALNGLNQVEVVQRQTKALELAQASADRGEIEDAISKVRQVISENPLNRRANLMLKRLSRQQSDVTGQELGIYPTLKAVYRTPVSMSFTGANLKQVFDSLKLASGLNYLFDKDVSTDGRVTMSFKDKPVEDVLRLILATNQLSYRVLDGDTLLVYPSTPAKSAEYREMVVRSFYLTNADVNKTSNLVRSIAKAKDVYVDERLNLIIVRDSAEVVRLAEKLIAAADMVEPEVMLELEVMEVNVNRLQQIGIQWPSSISGSVRGASGVAGQLTLDELQERSKSLVRINLSDPLVSAQLRNQTGNTNLLANPRVRVRNRQSAKIMIGDKVPVITVTNTANVGTSESVSYLDVGLKLDIEPTISLDDEVAMKINLEVSNITDTITRTTGTQTYRLGTRNTSTVLRVRDGETNVLAGLIQKEDRRSNTGVPVLNELPLVSKLFGAAQDSDSKTEIVLLITPRIIRNLDLPGVGIQEFNSGTENAVGAAPIQLGTRILKNSTASQESVQSPAPAPQAVQQTMPDALSRQVPEEPTSLQPAAQPQPKPQPEVVPPTAPTEPRKPDRTSPAAPGLPPLPPTLLQ